MTPLGKLDHLLIMHVGSVEAEQIWDAVEAAIAEEREACAKVVDDSFSNSVDRGFVKPIADAIRARGAK